MSAAPCLRSDDDASHNALAERLTAIWSRTLRVSPIAPDSNFFDLGGDSLLAVGLFLEIEREMGIHLPITAIYDTPTIAALAELIAGNAAPTFSPLVRLKPGDAGAPFFIVHGIGGTVMELAALGRKMGIREPIYALQAKGLDGSSPPLDSVESMAEFYLDHIRQTQPTGPYWLCGYSFGGLVAMEMARRLKSANEDIALLILMDAYAHPATWPAASRSRMHVRRTFHRVRQIARQPLPDAAWLLLRYGRSALKRAHNFISPPAGNRAAARPMHLRKWLLDRNPDLPLPLLQVREAADAALSTYVPRFYPGKVTFLKAACRDEEFPDDPQTIWGQLVQDLELYTVPGGHRTLVTEYSDAIASRLTACIVETRRQRAREFPARPNIVRSFGIATDNRLEVQAV